MPKLLPLACPHSCSPAEILSFCNVCAVEFSHDFPKLRLSYLLGMLDGSIQGAEESTTFLHHTMEMHLMEKVALSIAEILGTKPGKRRQQATYGKAQRRGSTGTDIISFVFSSTTVLFSDVPVPAAQTVLVALLLDYCLLHSSSTQNQNLRSLQLNLTEELPFPFSLVSLLEILWS